MIQDEIMFCSTQGVVHCNLRICAQLLNPFFLFLRMSQKFTVLAQSFLRV